MVDNMDSIRRLLVLAEPRGATDVLERVLDRCTAEVDAVAVVGNLTEVWSKPETYRALFKMLGQSGLRGFWVPGRDDAPLREYLAESRGLETAFPLLAGVHGTFALAPGNVYVAGMGGEIVDAPDTPRGEEFLVRYPGWEVEYRLKMLRDLDWPLGVFLFASQPAHKGLGTPGSQVLAELINTYVPRVVVVGGEQPAQAILGKSLMVAPGRLDRGHHAIVDLRERSADMRRIEPAEVQTAGPVAVEGGGR
jgi:uncharacterized protein